MTWAKLDDQYFRHPKSRAAGKDGRALDLAAICYSSSALTDGFISKAALPLIAAEAEVRPGVVRRLVDAGRWDEVADGWQIHNYETRQRTRAEVDAEREATRDRVKRHRDKRRSNGVTPTVSNGVANRQVTASDTEADTDSHQLPLSEPPGHPQAGDDDERRIEPPPTTPTDLLVADVLNRCADTKMRAATPRNPGAYRAKVIAKLAHAEGPRLLKLIADHDTAPADVLAGALLGEPNHLADYRTKTSA